MASERAAFRALVEQASDAILLLDADGAIAYANPAAADLFGRPFSALIGENFGSVATSEQQSEFYIPHPQRGLVATNVRSAAIVLADITHTALYLRDGPNALRRINACASLQWPSIASRKAS